MKKDVMIVTGAGQISMAIARRVGFGKKIVLGDKNMKNCETIARIMNDAGYDVKEVTLEVKAVAPKISGTLKKGKAGQAYNATLKAKGTTPITWSINGELPSGITFRDGVFSGTSAKYFKGSITVIASNDGGYDSKTFTLELKAEAPKITSKTLASGTQGRSYSASLTATGTPDITWSWRNYPSGLTLSEDSGIISGIPTVYGTFKIKVTAKNDVKSVNKTIKLVIAESSGNASVSYESEDTGDEEEYYGSVSDLPEGMIIAAELPEVSVDVSGQYDFAVTLSESAPVSAKLFWVANSEKPSDDDAIADFFDSDGQDINAVPANHEVIVSAWLNKNITYKPIIAVKE